MCIAFKRNEKKKIKEENHRTSHMFKIHTGEKYTDQFKKSCF
jgi:hypothetical protein